MNASLCTLLLPLLLGSNFHPSGVATPVSPLESTERVTFEVPLREHVDASAPAVEVDGALRLSGARGWIELAVEVPAPGRYRTELELLAAEPAGEGPVLVWLEDYVGNPDERHYDITGPITVSREGGTVARDGSPLWRGPRRMRLHHDGGEVVVRALRFERLRPALATPATLVQRTQGDAWTLVWADEFDTDGPPDPGKWAHDIGDWGWGNREPQYYTDAAADNARVQDGKLLIEARRGDLGRAWTSARLTTRGVVSFLYGRIEIAAKVPAADGAWAAGWLLGDAYEDERSWPYCGEIDVMEAVGREIDDATGDGRNHASCHTRAYYFKQGNHISSVTPVARMASAFHVYTLEWWPDRVEISVDGRPYYVYDKTSGPLEWPFDNPQNLILNLAMGGGMGGPIPDHVQRAVLEVDYVRVYGRQ